MNGILDAAVEVDRSLAKLGLKFCLIGGIVGVFSVTLPGFAAEPSDTNYDESKVPRYQLPDPLVDNSGRAVTHQQQWTTRRRGEVLRLFAANVYGSTPAKKLTVRYEVSDNEANALRGRASRRQVAAVFGDEQLRLDVLVYAPNGIDGPVPCFLGLNFYGNQTVHQDPGIQINPRWMRGNSEIGVEQHRATERTRGAYADRWQVETLMQRGYALATLYCGDIDPDNYQHDFSDGVHPLFYEARQTQPQPTEWGAIGAWAWGLSRALDYLETDDRVDASRVAVIGHSRLGKTALWAGAQDQRFAMAISNNSGCGGAALYRRCYGERIHHMIKPVGYWFCFDHRNYAQREHELPVDQHMLLALIAPRPLYVASAVEDRWADPKGEFLSAKHASRVYQLWGKEALANAEMPDLDQPIHSSIGYHIRSGGHGVTAYDWHQYLKFADQWLGKE